MFMNVFVVTLIPRQVKQNQSARQSRARNLSGAQTVVRGLFGDRHVVNVALWIPAPLMRTNSALVRSRSMVPQPVRPIQERRPPICW